MKASEKARRDNIVLRRQTNDLKEETESKIQKEEKEEIIELIPHV